MGFYGIVVLLFTGYYCVIFDVIKSAESHVEDFPILRSPTSGNLEMLRFDANSIKIGYPVTEL